MTNAHASSAFVYARYSTDQQNQTSIDDQTRVCKKKAALLGLNVIAVRADEAISGSLPVAARPGGKALLEDALAGKFSVLLLEGLDRLSRDLVEQETIVRRLEHRGIRIIGVSDGYDSETDGSSRQLMRGVRGLINETYITDLSSKTRRGMAGQIARGFHVAGPSYGYRSQVAATNGKGEPIGYKLEIVPEEAAIVRRIYDEFGKGLSCQKIAHGLNDDFIKGPRSGTWGVSVLYGSPRKGSGILNNEIYVGKVIWNRSHWVKDPDTHKRVRLDRPKSEWVIEEKPDLRIVSDEQWAKVRERIGGLENRGKGTGTKVTPRRKNTLLGGLIKCGKCGGAVIAVDAHSYGCANAKNHGPTVCAGVRAPRAELERKIIACLRDELVSHANVAEITSEAHDIVRKYIKDMESDRKRRARRLTTASRRASRSTARRPSRSRSVTTALRLFRYRGKPSSWRSTERRSWQLAMKPGT